MEFFSPSLLWAFVSYWLESCHYFTFSQLDLTNRIEEEIERGAQILQRAFYIYRVHHVGKNERLANDVSFPSRVTNPRRSKEDVRIRVFFFVLE